MSNRDVHHRPILLLARDTGKAARWLNRLAVWGVPMDAVTIVSTRAEAEDWGHAGRGVTIANESELTGCVEQMIYERHHELDVSVSEQAESLRRLDRHRAWTRTTLGVGIVVAPLLLAMMGYIMHRLDKIMDLLLEAR